MNVTRIGLDIAKTIFQIHGVDGHGKATLRKTLKREKVTEFFANLSPCVVGIEACGSAHHWARTLGRLGHTVRLMAGQFVAPYRKGGKNDGNDAEAICEAVGRPTMRFVPTKSEEQQAVLALHRARSLAVENRTAQANQIRGLLAEFGLVVPQGIETLRAQLPTLLQAAGPALPSLAREVLEDLSAELRQWDERIAGYDRRIAQLAAASEPAQRLMQVAGIGPLTATALVASVGDAKVFTSGRQFAAWLGMVPRQHSSGGKFRLGSITKRGDGYLRRLLIHGARSVIATLSRRDDAKSQWARALQERSGANVATVALAAKHARIVWAILTKGEAYQPA
jgi:transposase